MSRHDEVDALKQVPHADRTGMQERTPRDRPYRLFDGGGAYLEVVRTGAKYRRLKYRYGGKEKHLAIGVYPTVTARRVREKAHDEKRKLSEGRDPSAERRAHKRVSKVAAGNSFEAVAREWLERRALTLTDKHVEKVLARLVENSFPWIGGRPIAEIAAPERLGALRRVENGARSIPRSGCCSTPDGSSDTASPPAGANVTSRPTFEAH